MPFSPQEIDPAAPSSVQAYARAGGADRLSISRPSPGGVPLVYARSASVAARPAGLPATYQCVIGVPTAASDVRNFSLGTTSVYARTIIGGTIYDGSVAGTPTYITTPSTASLSIDRLAGQVTLSVRLVGVAGTGSAATGTKDFGTWSGTAILNADGSFYGQISGGGSGIVSGQFGGQLFGREGSEVGIATTMRHSTNNNVTVATIYASR